MWFLFCFNWIVFLSGLFSLSLRYDWRRKKAIAATTSPATSTMIALFVDFLSEFLFVFLLAVFFEFGFALCGDAALVAVDSFLMFGSTS